MCAVCATQSPVCRLRYTFQGSSVIVNGTPKERVNQCGKVEDDIIWYYEWCEILDLTLPRFSPPKNRFNIMIPSKEDSSTF